MNNSPSRLKVGLVILLVFVGYGIVGRMDYEDQVAQEEPRTVPTMVASQGNAQ